MPRSKNHQLKSNPTAAFAAAMTLALTTAARAVPPVELAGPDFDGDGRADLAIGAPGESIGTIHAGAVHVIYGDTERLTNTGSQLFTPLTAGMTPMTGLYASFGSSLTWGDYNGDGFDDLAVSAPYTKTHEDQVFNGVVYVLFGSSHGLRTIGHQVLTGDNIGAAAQFTSGSFGRAVQNALASGDFNHDGFTDLAVASQTMSPDALANSGAVHVLRGSAQGLRRTSAVHWTQDSPGIWNLAESNEFFGTTLVVGDFNGDQFDDLAITVREGLNDMYGVGAVHILHGSAAGLSATNDQFWHQNSPGIANQISSGDSFGQSMVAGDFNGDGYHDLAVGVPGESLRVRLLTPIIEDCGAAHILFGGPNGLSAAGSQFIWAGLRDMPLLPRTDKHFGSHLASGDFDGDGDDELVVGMSSETLPALYCGAVLVLNGGEVGVSIDDARLFTQNTPGIADNGEYADNFGDALGVADFNGDGFTDLAIAASYENSGAGQVHVLYGSANHLQAFGSQLWHQDTQGIAGERENYDGFGRVLCR